MRGDIYRVLHEVHKGKKIHPSALRAVRLGMGGAHVGGVVQYADVHVWGTIRDSDKDPSHGN